MNNAFPDAATLAPTPLIDSHNPEVQGFARKYARGGADRERAVSLYYAVRDGFRYDPYRIDLSVAGMRASQVLEIGVGWCVTKAALLAAAARAAPRAFRVGCEAARSGIHTGRCTFKGCIELHGVSRATEAVQRARGRADERGANGHGAENRA